MVINIDNITINDLLSVYSVHITETRIQTPKEVEGGGGGGPKNLIEGQIGLIFFFFLGQKRAIQIKRSKKNLNLN